MRLTFLTFLNLFFNSFRGPTDWPTRVNIFSPEMASHGLFKPRKVFSGFSEWFPNGTCNLTHHDSFSDLFLLTFCLCFHFFTWSSLICVLLLTESNNDWESNSTFWSFIDLSDDTAVRESDLFIFVCLFVLYTFCKGDRTLETYSDEYLCLCINLDLCLKL